MRNLLIDKEAQSVSPCSVGLHVVTAKLRLTVFQYKAKADPNLQNLTAAALTIHVIITPSLGQ